MTMDPQAIEKRLKQHEQRQSERLRNEFRVVMLRGALSPANATLGLVA